METVRYGVFGAVRYAGGPVPASEWPADENALLRKEERDAAILADKLPSHEQDHDRKRELSLASWLALMNL